jgi:hypothetical protein
MSPKQVNWTEYRTGDTKGLRKAASVIGGVNGATGGWGALKD